MNQILKREIDNKRHRPLAKRQVPKGNLTHIDGENGICRSRKQLKLIVAKT